MSSSLGKEKSPLFKYNDRVVSTNIVFEAKQFLMDTVLGHTNSTVRAYAANTIGYAFPRDMQISKWVFDQYFFNKKIGPKKRGKLIFIINRGSFDDLYSRAVIKDGLMSGNVYQQMAASQCVRENHDLYSEFLPDLIVSLLTLKERSKQKGFDRPADNPYVADANACYLMLKKSIHRYEEIEVFHSAMQEIDKKWIYIKTNEISNKKLTESIYEKTRQLKNKK